MSIVQKVKQFFSAQSETADRHIDEQLKSHYYKANKNTALQAVQDVLQKMNGCKITSVSDERGEISVAITAPRKAFLVVTVVTVRPFETSVDFIVSTDTPIPTDFGFSKKFIVELYEKLDKQLLFIGKGLGEK